MISYQLTSVTTPILTKITNPKSLTHGSIVQFENGYQKQVMNYNTVTNDGSTYNVNVLESDKVKFHDGTSLTLKDRLWVKAVLLSGSGS